MERQAFLDTITEIGTCTDDSTRRSLLANLGNSAAELFDSVESLTEANGNFEKQVAKLQEDNMTLFLQIGENRKTTTPGGEPPAEKRTYENLFNEEGKLK